jgi:hypothetical protein
MKPMKNNVIQPVRIVENWNAYLGSDDSDFWLMFSLIPLLLKKK